MSDLDLRDGSMVSFGRELEREELEDELKETGICPICGTVINPVKAVQSLATKVNEK